MGPVSVDIPPKSRESAEELKFSPKPSISFMCYTLGRCGRFISVPETTTEEDSSLCTIFRDCLNKLTPDVSSRREQSEKRSMFRHSWPRFKGRAGPIVWRVGRWLIEKTKFLLTQQGGISPRIREIDGVLQVVHVNAINSFSLRRGGSESKTWNTASTMQLRSGSSRLTREHSVIAMWRGLLAGVMTACL